MSGVVTIPLFGAFTPIEWIHVGILILSAVAGSIGYYSVVLATRDGDVAVIAPFRYTRLVFAMILAVLIFDEQITPLMIAGSLLIIISGIGVLGFTWPARQRVP
jgi:Predicted membrane protein